MPARKINGLFPHQNVLSNLQNLKTEKEVNRRLFEQQNNVKEEIKDGAVLIQGK